MTLQSLKHAIKSYPVAAFFALTYTISWGLWAFTLSLAMENRMMRDIVMSVGIFGPAIAGVVIARLLGTSKVVSHKWKMWLTLVVSWVLVTAVLVANAINRGTPTGELFKLVAVVGVFALVPAYIVSRAFSGAQSVATFMVSLVRPTGPKWTYLFALGLFPAFLYAGVFLTHALGIEAPLYYSDRFDGNPILLTILIQFGHTFFFGGGVTEEPGWRGFALPRLLARQTPMVASLVLALFWILWHAPLKFGPMATHPPMDVINEWTALLCITIIFTWLCLRSRGSILAAALLHTSMNTASHFLPITTGSNILLGVIVVYCFVSERMWAVRPRGLNETA